MRLGRFLGRVGNTGNTDEPHLRVHVQRPGTTKIPFGGDPLSILFDGRYLHRNAKKGKPVEAGHQGNKGSGGKRPRPDEPQ